MRFFSKPTGIHLPGIKKTIYPLEWNPDEPGALTKWRRYIASLIRKEAAIKPNEKEREEEQYWANVEAETGIKH